MGDGRGGYFATRRIVSWFVDIATHGTWLFLGVAPRTRTGNKFHLESLTDAHCSDDPDISSGDPLTAFDTYEGEGTGRYNGQPGAEAKWRFTDAGEPGTNDLVELEITFGETSVLDVSGTLEEGNHQAHAI